MLDWVDKRISLGNILEIVMIVGAGFFFLIRLEARQEYLERVLKEYKIEIAEREKHYINREVYNQRAESDERFQDEIRRRLERIEQALK